MSDYDQLRAIQSQTLAMIVLVTAGPKNNYMHVGQAVSWADYLARLRVTVDWCERKLAGHEPF